MYGKEIIGRFAYAFPQEKNMAMAMGFELYFEVKEISSIF